MCVCACDHSTHNVHVDLRVEGGFLLRRACVMWARSIIEVPFGDPYSVHWITEGPTRQGQHTQCNPQHHHTWRYIGRRLLLITRHLTLSLHLSLSLSLCHLALRSRSLTCSVTPSLSLSHSVLCHSCALTHAHTRHKVRDHVYHAKIFDCDTSSFVGFVLINTFAGK